MAWKKSRLIKHKTFNNTFFNDKEILMQRLDYFLKNEKKDNEKGIPYNFGIMMHGVPGCGKTSSIKGYC